MGRISQMETALGGTGSQATGDRAIVDRHGRRLIASAASGHAAHWLSSRRRNVRSMVMLVLVGLTASGTQLAAVRPVNAIVIYKKGSSKPIA